MHLRLNLNMYNALRELDTFNELERELKTASAPLSVSGCMSSQKLQLVSELNSGWMLYITANEKQASEAADDLRCFNDSVWIYPARDLLFDSSDIQGSFMRNQRMDAVKHLLEQKRGVLVTTVDALMEPIAPRNRISERKLRLFEGMVIQTAALSAVLTELGYRHVTEVESAGEYAVRGGIFDIYPVSADEACRVEFFDEEIDTIRSFDTQSQRSIERIEEIFIYPADSRAGNGGTKAEEVSLYTYFDRDALIVLDDPVRLKAQAEATETEFAESTELRLRKGLISDQDQERVNRIFSASEIMETLCSSRALLIAGLDEALAEFGAVRNFRFNTASAGNYKDSFELLISDIKSYQKQGYRISVLSPSRTRCSRLAENLREYGIRAYCPDDDSEGNAPGFEAVSGAGAAAVLKDGTAAKSEEAEAAGGKADTGTASGAAKPAGAAADTQIAATGRNSSTLQPGTTEVVCGSLRQGFIYPDIKYILMTEADMFGARSLKKRRKRRKYEGDRLISLNELSSGDYVVHEGHGIGIYRGLEHIVRDGCGKDYIKIEYADGGKLYLPATKLDLIQKYADSSAKRPKLNKLNSTEWARTRQKTVKAVNDIARELVQLYAKRLNGRGFSYSRDTVWQREFEELFPYEETEDQLNAIAAVKADMESSRIMDRLICGDVGFGKTEIALRAAFKAVQDGKQVIFLVPTTILAQQHYNTFVQRLSHYPVKIEMMSRFRTAEQNRKTAAQLKKGVVDIVIGTHRLLSKDVEYKNPGLLIIDEEQRFGVSHKEKIKQLRNDLDVLSLTATPIPRTLHMSLSGIRDLSTLEEPPFDRVPIQTYVMEYNDEFVREAAERELTRNGQVFYVFNHVSSIAEKTDQLRALLPDARIEYAHGQMNERELEDIMSEFVSGEIDVLVSTTIVETGLDIPNANTLIVDGAERMGLSQLYQLRGRVGRSNRTSYAFFMYRKDKILSEDAEKRLKAIREFTEFGAGIRIAMRDLEIRGAGNVLGAEQHGQMQAVGYDLYCKLLSQAVRLMQSRAADGEMRDLSLDADMLKDSALAAGQATDSGTAVGTGIGSAGGINTGTGPGSRSGAGAQSAYTADGTGSAGTAGSSLALENSSQISVETSVDCDVDAYIPDTYIPDEYHKLDIYKRIAEIETAEEYTDMQDELIDRYGDIPASVQNLLDIVMLKVKARKAYITELNIGSGSISMLMHPRADIRVEAIPGLMEQEKGRLKFYRGTTPKFVYTDKHAGFKGTEQMMKKADELITCLIKC